MQCIVLIAKLIRACGKYPFVCLEWPRVFNADSTYVSELGAIKLARFIPVMLVATKPGNTDCTIIPRLLYSVDKSSENLSTNACKEINKLVCFCLSCFHSLYFLLVPSRSLPLQLSFALSLSLSLSIYSSLYLSLSRPLFLSLLIPCIHSIVFSLPLSFSPWMHYK